MKKIFTLAALAIAISASAATKGSWPTNVCKSPSWFADESYDVGWEFYSQGDTVSAAKCFQKSAKAGNSGGQYIYGLFKMGGFGGVKVNQKAGLRMIQQAAQNGESSALCFLGGLYEYGEYGYPVNKAEALELYKKASQAGSLDGHIACGDTYWNNADTIMAKYYWAKAVEDANPYFVLDEQREALAQITYNLGWFSQYDKHQDYDAATDYYQQSVQYGNTKDAAFQLGLMSLDTEDETNQVLAAYYFSLAAEGGNSEAYVYLGDIERLIGTDEQALMYYLAAAQGGSANGMYCVASLYYEREEYDSTIFWASQCKDNVLAEYLLGCAYYNLEDYVQAKYYWQRCVKYHLDEAIIMLRQLESGVNLNRSGIVEL